MKNCTLIEIMESIVENGGLFPGEHEPLIEKLVEMAIICNVARNNGNITADLGGAHLAYYKQFALIRNKSQLTRLKWWVQFFSTFEFGNIEKLNYSIRQVEEIRQKLIPETQNK